MRVKTNQLKFNGVLWFMELLRLQDTSYHSFYSESLPIAATTIRMTMTHSGNLAISSTILFLSQSACLLCYLLLPLSVWSQCLKYLIGTRWAHCNGNIMYILMNYKPSILHCILSVGVGSNMFSSGQTIVYHDGNVSHNFVSPWNLFEGRFSSTWSTSIVNTGKTVKTTKHSDLSLERSCHAEVICEIRIVLTHGGDGR